MAFNPSPKVAAARDYGQKFDRDIVVVISFNKNSSRYEIVSYGKTKELCDQGDMIGSLLERAILGSGLKL